MDISLFRPVGLHELALMWDMRMRGFPPRLAHQPIFYPILTLDYAGQIARDWNTTDEKSGFAGYVSAFSVDGNYLSKFQQRKVGSSLHIEFWIPAEDVDSFNTAIRGQISVQSGYFGPQFIGYISNSLEGEKKDAVAQLLALLDVHDKAKTNPIYKISLDPKSVFLNWLFWAQHDFSIHGLDCAQRDVLLGALRRHWESTQIEIRLPQPINP